MKLQKHSKQEQYSITLPKRIIKYKGWKQGDEIEVTESRNGILLKKKD